MDRDADGDAVTRPGAYRAVVLSTADPRSSGRVRVQVPQVSGDAPTDWVPPAQSGAAVPAVGQVVWVVYEGGDPSYPVYVPPAPAPYTPPPGPAWQIQAAPAVGGMTLGNGVVVSRYLAAGPLVHWSLTLTWGSTSTASPAAAITVDVPVAPDPGSAARWPGVLLINPAGGNAFRSGGAWLFPGQTAVTIEAQRPSDLAYVPFSTISLSIAPTGWLTMNMTYDRAV